MKFITEIDLRDLYRKEPFTHYELEPGARFTPGARQFLSDKGINILDNGPYTNKKAENKKKAVEKQQIVGKQQIVEKQQTVEGKQAINKNINKNEISALLEKRNKWRKKKLYSKMKSVEALFLITEEELLNRDAFLAQSLINLGKQFTKIKNAWERCLLVPSST